MLKKIAVISDSYDSFTEFMDTFQKNCVTFYPVDRKFIFDKGGYIPSEYKFYNVHEHDALKGSSFDEALFDTRIDPNEHEFFFKCVVTPALYKGV
jgi:hypothetical protein